ncbi:C3HC zinc finger-like-domain-containing protein [Xylaria bambusicola]|uniref:C3HC zinc finger-like-domain-containing protein n=1 Tax=Xylaria bambusicola TaxID=326684 RepID=UPI00200767B3|nr:C3HC zinc finger-like-domain-containing protein [Xylaria bambusicola]KAI0518074.1 C3HC zinc finger-like-domain-containing protein [Xylaria bambusicola]
MNATKRKFNTLIQGIGARSPHVPDLDDRYAPIQDEPTASSPLSQLSASISTPDATAKASAPTHDPPSPSTDLNKRRRIGVVEMTPPSGKTGTTTISNVVLKKWAATPPKVATPQKATPNEPPRYCPSDRDALIRRLGTFQELTEWTPKPDKINEIEWAKRGWVCQGGERVRCTLCNKELLVKINNTKIVDGKQVPMVVGSDVEQGLAKRYSELIIEAHEEDCLWRRHGCDDSLLRLPLAVPQTALTSLRERYDDLCTRSSFLPYIFNLRLSPALDIKAAHAQLPPTFFTKPTPPSTNSSTPNDVALTLALTGWQGLTNSRIGAVPNTATCATCLRRLGLWMFKSKEVDEATGEVLVPAPMDHLDPVREHRFFCPWRSATAQQNPGAKTKDTKAGWEILAQTLKNSAYLRQQAGKSAHRNPFHRAAASLPGTPSRSNKRDVEEQEILATPEKPGGDEEEDLAARDAKDKERWAKLRRVKSLFDTKGRKKQQRALSSRPGTASSRPPTAHSRQESVGGGKV